MIENTSNVGKDGNQQTQSTQQIPPIKKQQQKTK